MDTYGLSLSPTSEKLHMNDDTQRDASKHPQTQIEFACIS